MRYAASLLILFLAWVVLPAPTHADNCADPVQRDVRCMSPGCSDEVTVDACTAVGTTGRCTELCWSTPCCNKQAWNACINSDCIYSPISLGDRPDSAPISVYVPTCAGGFATVTVGELAPR